MRPWLYTILSALELVIITISSSIAASAREVVLPAGTILHCVLNEPNFSSATVEVGDPVLCHLRGLTEFNEQAFPRGSYLVGHLAAVKDPGHFFGKGYLKLEFDRIGVPGGDIPLTAKVIGTRGYKVDREGKIDGKGHAKRDVAEWMLPPLWPWKVIMLPARGPRPKLKSETELSLRLMDDVQLPQLPPSFGHESNSRGSFQRESFRGLPPDSTHSILNAPVRDGSQTRLQNPHQIQSYGPEWHFFGESQNDSPHNSIHNEPKPTIRDVPSREEAPMTTATPSYATYVSGAGLR